MALKTHHKILIGSFSSIIIIFMVVSGILTYTLFIKQNANYNSLKQQVTDVESKIGELTENLIETKASLEQNQEQLSLLKASAGEDFSGIVGDAIESVVTIKTSYSQGTGFIINDEGYVVTNAHVLADPAGKLAQPIESLTYNQGTKQAEYIGHSNELDLALLKISGTYNSLKLANSDEIQIGEKVIAIGNPLGLQFSVSEGIVSAIDRKGTNGLEAYIQTDAALNPGNSGGPLINKQGEVIGINNFKVSGGENLGFALESNYIKEIVNQISQQTLNQTLIE